jgi:hypothetical protein
MSYERRLYPRTAVNWIGHATLTEGPQLPVRVLDVSAGGARLEVPAVSNPARQELMELTAFRRSFWPFTQGRSINALGRVVRTAPGSDETRMEISIRFHTPLRDDKARMGLPRFPAEWAFGPNLAPTA